MNKSTKVALFTLAISLIVLLLKTKAYYATLSVSVLSDALETVVNVITAMIALIAVKIANEPADEDHPYGHGKLEYFSASVEGGLIFFAALAILFQSVKSFFIVVERGPLLEGNIYLIAASIINLILGFYLVRHGQKSNSEALRASGKHILSDVVTTIGVILGLFLAQITGLVWIDSVVAFLVGLFLLREAYKILRTTISALMDATDMESIKMLATAFNQHRQAEIIDIHNIKTIRAGKFHHIDAHVVVPEFLDVATIHEITHQFEMKVVRDYKYEGEIAFHIDPCAQAYCQQCQLQGCKIRKTDFVMSKTFDQNNLIKGPKSHELI